MSQYSSQNRKSKQQIREETHLTRPPRMEGSAKEAKMQPKRKKSTKLK